VGQALYRSIFRSFVVVAIAVAWPLAAAADWDMERAINAYASGDYKQTIALLDAAVESGQGADQMPRVLLYRGLAYRKNGQPGMAIADLTNALRRPEGLSDEEHAAAERNRRGASQEAGIDDAESVIVATPPVGTRQARAVAAAAQVAAPPPKSTAPTETAAITERQAPAATSWSGATRVARAPPQVPAPTPPTASPAKIAAAPPQAAPANTWVSAAPTKVVAAPLKVTPSPPKVAPAAATTQLAVARIPTAAPAAQPFVTQVTPAVIVELKPASVSLQLATANSRSEAFALSVRLTSQYGTAFAGRRLRISETALDNQAPVYRLRLGPYASVQQTQDLCSQVRAGGYDCIVE
jgi:tetratricopeptide (TPR) repeat protein